MTIGNVYLAESIISVKEMSACPYCVSPIADLTQLTQKQPFKRTELKIFKRQFLGRDMKNQGLIG